MKTKKNLFFSIILIVGVLTLVNVLSRDFFFRLDFTQDERYTLSEATKNILGELDELVTVVLYFSEDVQPGLLKVQKDFIDLLDEYASLSNGNIVYEVISPNEDEELEKEAMQNGIQSVIASSGDKNSSVQKKVYMGAVIKIGEQKEVIPFMQGGAMEYALSTSIKKLSVLDKPVIGFLQGHGEPGIMAMQEAYYNLNVLYEVQEVSLTDSTRELDKYTTIAIIAPKDSFPETELAQLDEFMARGNNLFIAMNRVNGDLQRGMGEPLTTGLETWLSRKGLTVENNFVVDANCASVNVRRQQGQFTFAQAVNFPYLPILTNFNEHVITKGLEQLLFEFASTITFTGDTVLKYQPLVTTSNKSGTQPAPLYFNVDKQWQTVDFPLQNLTVGALLSGPIVGPTPSNLVVIADGDFAVNGEGQGARRQQPDNISLMVNSIDWLTDETGLIDLRTKGITNRQLDEVEEGSVFLIKLLNFLLPILLIVILGIVRMQINKNKRVKRMEADYV